MSRSPGRGSAQLPDTWCFWDGELGSSWVLPLSALGTSAQQTGKSIYFFSWDCFSANILKSCWVFQLLSSSSGFLLDFLYPSQMVAALGFARTVLLRSVIASGPKDPPSTPNHLIMSQWGKCHFFSPFLPSNLPNVMTVRGYGTRATRKASGEWLFAVSRSKTKCPKPQLLSK